MSKDFFNGDHTFVVSGDLTLDVSGDIILSKEPLSSSVETTETYAGIAANFININDMSVTDASGPYLEIGNQTSNPIASCKLVLPIPKFKPGTVLNQVKVGYQTSTSMSDETFGFYSYNVTGFTIFSETGTLPPAPPPGGPLYPVATAEINFSHALSGLNSNQIVIDLSFGAGRTFKLYYIRLVYGAA